MDAGKRFLRSGSSEVCMSKQDSTSTIRTRRQDRKKGCDDHLLPHSMPKPSHSWPSLTLPWKNGRSLPLITLLTPSMQNHSQRKSARDQHRFAIIGEIINAIRRMMQFQRHDVDLLGCFQGVLARWVIGRGTRACHVNRAQASPLIR